MAPGGHRREQLRGRRAPVPGQRADRGAAALGLVPVPEVDAQAQDPAHHHRSRGRGPDPEDSAEHALGRVGHVGRESGQACRARGEPVTIRCRGGESAGPGSNDRGRHTARRGSSRRLCVRDGAGPACRCKAFRVAVHRSRVTPVIGRPGGDGSSCVTHRLAWNVRSSGRISAPVSARKVTTISCSERRNLGAVIAVFET